MPFLPPHRRRYILLRFASAAIGYLTIGAVLGIAIAFYFVLVSGNPELRQPPGSMQKQLIVATLVGGMAGAFIGFCIETAVNIITTRFGARTLRSSRNKRTETYLDKLEIPKQVRQ